jgi:hypothetical protein
VRIVIDCTIYTYDYLYELLYFESTIMDNSQISNYGSIAEDTPLALLPFPVAHRLQGWNCMVSINLILIIICVVIDIVFIKCAFQYDKLVLAFLVVILIDLVWTAMRELYVDSIPDDTACHYSQSVATIKVCLTGIFTVVLLAIPDDHYYDKRLINAIRVFATLLFVWSVVSYEFKVRRCSYSRELTPIMQVWLSGTFTLLLSAVPDLYYDERMMQMLRVFATLLFVCSIVAYELQVRRML